MSTRNGHSVRSGFGKKRHSERPPRPPAGKAHAAQQINAVGDVDSTIIDGEISISYNWLKNHRDIALDPKERDQATDPRTRDMGIDVQEKKYLNPDGRGSEQGHLKKKKVHLPSLNKNEQENENGEKKKRKHHKSKDKCEICKERRAKRQKDREER